MKITIRRGLSTNWRVLRQVGICIACVGIFTSTQAQSSGQGAVAGTVSNLATGTLLEGAEVTVVGTTTTVLTQRDGSFTVSQLAPGSHRLRVFYTGLDTKEVAVEIRANETARVPVALTSGIYQLEAYTVAGEREGNAAAITRQRNAENLVNVVSTDAYGDVADGNLANFIQNLPSVAAMKQSGDLVGIGVRGTPPELNSVMLDGTRFASAIAGSTAGLGDRTQFVDRIPAEFIKEITVTKGNTPEQPADSLGGSVNLVTKSAFDFKGRTMTYRAGLTKNVARDDLHKYGPSAALSYFDTFGKNRQYGVGISGSYSKSINAVESVWMNFPTADDRASRARQLNDIAERERAGVSGKLEYRLDESARISLSGAINYYAFNDDRVNWDSTAGGGSRIADYARVSRAQILAGAAPLDSTGQAAGIAPGFDRNFTEMLSPSLTNQVGREERRSHQHKIGVAGEKKWGASKLTASASHNPSSFDNNFFGFTVARGGTGGLLVDRSKSVIRPTYSQTYGPTIGLGSNFALWTASRFEQPDTTLEDVSDSKLDYELPVSLGNVSVVFKSGLNYRFTKRTLKTYRPTWLLVGPDGFQGVRNGVNDDNIAQFLTPKSYSLFNNSMWMWDTFDLAKVEANFRSSPNQWAPSGTTVSTFTPDRSVAEGAGAGYIQGNTRIGPVNLLGGVRIERTNVEAQGTYADPLRPAIPVVKVDRDYQRTFPSIHLRYAVTRALLARASYSTSSARPSISSLIPNTTISYLSDGSGLGTVRQNNPGIRPNYTKTYDVSFEYYFEPAGVISVGGFRKDVTDFINTETRVIGAGAGNGFNGQYEGFNFVTSNNLGTAKIEGFEFNYSQQFRNLPRPFNGLSAFANITTLYTQGQYANGASQLANFVPRTLNFGVSYAWQKLLVRLTWRERSAFLSSYSATPASALWVDADPEYDLNIEYRWRPSATFFIDFVNLNNRSYDQYSIHHERVTNSASNGMRMNAGVSGRF